MRKSIIFLLLALMLLTGCGRTATENDIGASQDTIEDSGIDKDTASKTIDGEIKFYPTYNPDYKTASHEIFAFWFDIPTTWSAVDNSDDGYIYSIINDDKNILIEMGGCLADKTEDAFYASLAGKDGTIEDFTLRDECSAKKIIISKSKLCYVRPDGDCYIIFYVNANENNQWIEQNEEIISYIASSIRTTKESFGYELDEKSSISPDDLMLGDIKIGINYDELMSIMGEEPVTEDMDELGGTDAKLLSFSDDTQIYIVDNAVYTVNVISSKYATPRGLKVGDSVKRLEELYGKADNVSDNAWGYTYKGYELFTVVIEDNKVAQIQIDSLK